MEKILSKSPNPPRLRAVRLALAFPRIFKNKFLQSLEYKYGKIRIMLPMVSNVYEIDESKNLIREVHQDLLKKGYKILKKLPDIESNRNPAAALISEQLSENDFFAIGSNDLTMYTGYWQRWWGGC